MRDLIKYTLMACLVLLVSCKKSNDDKVAPVGQAFISAVDISQFPEISNTNPTFTNLNGSQAAFLKILQENGVNTIRLRLWVNPSNQHSSLNEVKQFSQTLRQYKFKIWLTLHYSDTWADPGKQDPPASWKNAQFMALKDSVFNYTKQVMQTINPDYIQIGNEINAGFLHPIGNITTNKENFIALLKAGCSAVRQHSTNCKIIMHFAGIQNASWFFNQIANVDYDVIGLSYYPIWHGKSFDELQQKVQELSNTHGKSIVMAETAYPFTLEWNDWTNNIVGQNSQLILPEFPATKDGQRAFVREIKRVMKSTKNGIGFCYWGAELISWKGNQSTSASPWENQALFDFENRALPVLMEFRDQ